MIADKFIWHDENHLQVGETHFVLTLEQEVADAVMSTPDRFLLVKN